MSFYVYTGISIDLNFSQCVGFVHLLNGIKVKTRIVRNKVRFLFYEGIIAPAIWSVIYNGANKL